jgi:hypothetical protein
MNFFKTQNTCFSTTSPHVAISIVIVDTLDSCNFPFPRFENSRLTTCSSRTPTLPSYLQTNTPKDIQSQTHVHIYRERERERRGGEHKAKPNPHKEDI